MSDPSRHSGTERDSLSRYRAIFESAVDFAIIATDRDGLVTDWNKGAETIFGWSAEEMVGGSVARFFTPEDRARGRIADEMSRSLQDGRSDDERWHLRKDGSRFWANGEMMPLRERAGDHLGFLKIVRDETERQAAAEKQRADHEFMQGVLSASDDCIKVLDLDANLLFMSEGGRRVMEVDDFELIRGCPWPDFWHGELNDEARAAVAAARAGRSAQFRGLTPTMAGNPRWWDVRLTPILGRDGKPETLLSISRDVTPAMLAEQALREGEAHWRGLFEKLQEGFVIGELVRDGRGRVSDWRYLDVNPAWGELIGIRPEIARGRTVRDLFPGIEDARVEEMADVVASGRSLVFTRQVGAIGRWYEGRAFPLDGDRFAALFLESTARRRAEVQQAALLDLGDRLREALDPVAASYAAGEILGRTLGVSRAGYGTIDPRTETFAVERDWNAPGVTTLAGSLQFRDFGSYIEDLKRGDTVVIGDAALDPRTTATAAELTAIDARAFINMPVLESGGFVALAYVNHAEPRAWTAYDIAFMREVAERTRSAVERRRAEGKLQDLAASLERQVDERTADRNRVWTSTNDLMGTAGLDGYLKEINPAWERSLGWDAATLLGRPFLALIDPADHAETLDVVGRLARGETVAGFVDRLRTRDGGQRTVMWDAVPAGPVFHIVGRDITEQREAEERLRQSQKMEAVGQLTGGIAHDFNNLLTGITGALDLMQRRIAQGRTTDVERYVGLAMSSANRAAALTHRLLAFSRRQTLDARPTAVARLVEELGDLIRRTIGPSIALDISASPNAWTALVDPNQLENAILNLCINARDAMPDGGRITVKTANRRIDLDRGRARDIEPGFYLALSVADTGTGMPPDVVARAFDPFFTTKPLGQGTGLGLSMIYGFARQSGGQVHIRSQPGQGTTVTLYLPRHDGEAMRPAERDRGPLTLPEAEQGETVLVVDDEPAVRQLVAEVLTDLGYTAVEAADGAGGLRILQSDLRVDLLVTDVGLPGGMNGRQVADAARMLRPNLKVLFITGYAENAVVGNGNLDPGMAVLAKPFAMDDLAGKVRSLIKA